MKGELSLHFQNGQGVSFTLDHVLVIDVPSQSVEFAKTKKGKWTMRITTGLLQGRMLCDNFLEARKIPDIKDMKIIPLVGGEEIYRKILRDGGGPSVN